MTDTIRVERTRDYGDVLAVVTHPRVWKAWSGGGDVTDDVPPVPEREYWLIASDAYGPLGAIRFEHRNRVAVEGHFGFQPRAWGLKAFTGAQAAHEWLFTAKHPPLPACGSSWVSDGPGERFYGAAADAYHMMNRT